MGAVPSFEINFKPTKKQWIAWQHLGDRTTNEILFGGGAGSAKSYLGASWLAISCMQYPGSRWLMGRHTFKTLKETTLVTLFGILASWGLTNEYFTWNGQAGTVTFYNGSVILLKDLATLPSDPNFDRLGSLEICGAFIDEVAEIDAKAKNIVRSRCRYKLEEFGIIPKVLMSCNPCKTFPYHEFFKPERDGTLDDDKKFVQALVYDNPHISPEYVKSLQKQDNATRERLLNGNWDYDDDPYALMDFEKICDIWTNEHAEPGSKYITADVAGMGSDKFVIMSWDGWRVTEIRSLDKDDGTQGLKIIKEMQRRHRVPNSNVTFDADGVGSYIRGHIPGAKPFVNNSVALKGENFKNLKTQCYFKFAELVQAGEIYIEPLAAVEPKIRETIIEELEQVKRDPGTDDGKLKLVTKDKIKDTIGRSPDYADALAFRIIFTLRHVTKSRRLRFV